MTATYKHLSGFFLERDTQTGGGTSGYYYGSTTEADNFTSTVDTIVTDNTLDLDFTDFQLIDFSGLSIDKNTGYIYNYGSSFSYRGYILGSLFRIKPNGVVDTTFAPSFNSSVYGLDYFSNGDILVCGSFTTANNVTRNRIARYKNNSVLDTTYNPNSNGTVYSVAIQSDQKAIVVGDFTTIGGVSRNYIARLNVDGTLDTTFNPNANAYIKKVKIRESDQAIFVLGEFTSIGGKTRYSIAKLKSDGTADDSFNAGTINGEFLGFEFFEEKILIHGLFYTINGNATPAPTAIARLNSNGLLDSSFYTPNILSFSGTLQRVEFLQVQDDKKILIGAKSMGAINEANSSDIISQYRIARINESGFVDKNFKNDNTQQIIYYLTGLQIQKDGKIVIQYYGDSFLNGKVTRLKELVDNAPYKLVYTAPANRSVILKDMFVTNHNDFPVFYDMIVLPEVETSMSISEKHYYVWDDLLQNNDYKIIPCNITLSPGDEIYVYSSTDENMSFNLFGTEIIQ